MRESHDSDQESVNIYKEQDEITRTATLCLPLAAHITRFIVNYSELRVWFISSVTCGHL